MAPAASSEDQPDQNQNSGPVMLLQQDVSPEILTGETFQPQDKGKCDDDQELEDPIEEETNVDDPDTELYLQVTTTTAAVGSCHGGGPTSKKIAMKRRAQEKKSQKKLLEGQPGRPCPCFEVVCEKR
ncbi:sodium-dependent phosphate transporter 2 [Corchorus olitorius]|uniref:Sodium-dependent phosphate transporter 2 n=1 Tax=Corchorus olitorius TaxID=93759 RepID=A0A1R3IF46_9ROSI|nr:sodium-dependent phosphate transporter 2 [Corchorus olitorius]